MQSSSQEFASQINAMGMYLNEINAKLDHLMSLTTQGITSSSESIDDPKYDLQLCTCQIIGEQTSIPF